MSTAPPQTTKAKLLDGRAIAEEIKSEVKQDAARLWQDHQVQPCLVAVRVGDDPASEVYVRNKVRAFEELGMRSEHQALDAATTTAQLVRLIETLNARDDVDGILVQLPLPKTIDEATIIEVVDPTKDADGFHPANVGLLAMGRPRFVPCTPAGVIALLQRSGIAIEGRDACVVGRSQIVGRPVAQLLLQRDATVTVCHSRTRDLAAATRQADILIAAIGRPGFIKGEHIKPGATVIDVGINRITDPDAARNLFGAESEERIAAIEKRGYTLVGDVHPAEADQIAGWRTPVPGGVGPLTIAMLLRNTVQAARWRRGL